MNKEMWIQPRGRAIYTQQGWFTLPMAKPRLSFKAKLLRALAVVMVWGFVIYLAILALIGG